MSRHMSLARWEAQSMSCRRSAGWSKGRRGLNLSASSAAQPHHSCSQILVVLYSFQSLIRKPHLACKMDVRWCQTLLQNACVLALALSSVVI